MSSRSDRSYTLHRPAEVGPQRRELRLALAPSLHIEPLAARRFAAVTPRLRSAASSAVR